MAKSKDLYSTMAETWTPVSSQLVTGRRWTAAIWFGVVFLATVAGSAGTWFFLPTFWAGLVTVVSLSAVVGLWVWSWIWAARNQASWGYVESDEELLVRGGLLFRRVIVVPYGRMQFVDVAAGPIASKLGYASVTLNTAATGTAATIPGVPTLEAHRLRDRLTELGASHDSGL